MILVCPRCNLFPTTALIYGAGPLVFDTHDFFLSGLHVRKRGGSAWEKVESRFIGSAKAVAAHNLEQAWIAIEAWAATSARQFPGLAEAAERMFDATTIKSLPKNVQARYLIATDRFEVDTTFAVLANPRQLEEVLIEELFHRALYKTGLRSERSHHRVLDPVLEHRATGLGYNRVGFLAPSSGPRIPLAVIGLGALGLFAYIMAKKKR